MKGHNNMMAPVKEQLFKDLFKDGKVGRLLEVRWAGTSILLVMHSRSR